MHLIELSRETEAEAGRGRDRDTRRDREEYPVSVGLAVEVEKARVEEDALAHGANDLAEAGRRIVVGALVVFLARRPRQYRQQRLSPCACAVCVRVL